MRWFVLILFHTIMAVCNVWFFIKLSVWKIYIPIRADARRIIIYKRLLLKDYPNEKICETYMRWLSFTTFLIKRQNLIALERLSNKTGIPFGVLQGYVDRRN